MERHDILAVIPARGNSKGIRRKNIRYFAGKPLLVHAIETAKKAPSVTRIIVSTDDKRAVTIAKKAGAEVPFLRPRHLATDTSNVVDAVIHLLDQLARGEDYRPTHVLLLQPTNPLRTADDIENTFKLLKKTRADSVVSVCKTENLLFTKDSRDALTIVNPDQAHATNRQQLPAYYRLDGCMIYLIKTDVLRKYRSFLAGKLIGYEIEKWRAVDLDEPEDFVVGELVFKHKKAIVERIKNLV